MIRKIIGIVGFCLMLAHQALPQGLTVGLDGGLQGTKYALQNGTNSLLPGGSVDLLYSFRVGGPFELLTGITGGVYRTKAELPNGSSLANYQVDDAGSAFQYGVKTTGYQETQRFLTAGIPLLLRYRSHGSGVQWYLEGGGKVLFPTSVSTEITTRQLSLTGYYPDFNVVVSDLPQHGFGTLANWKSHATTQLKPAAALLAATGVSFPIMRGMRLYTGLFVEYGLTPLKSKTDSMPLVNYSATGVNGVKGNGMLNTPNAGRVTSLSMGLQVRLSFEAARPKVSVRRSADTVRSNPADTTISEEEVDYIQRPIVFGVIQEVIIPDIAKDHLDVVVSILMRHPAVRLSVAGYVCNTESETEDPKVGVARARAVAQYLINAGVKPGRLDVRETGERDEIRRNHPAVNFQKRRAALTVK